MKNKNNFPSLDGGNLLLQFQMACNADRATGTRWRNAAPSDNLRQLPLQIHSLSLSLSSYRQPFPFAASNHGVHGGCVLRLKLASSDGSVTSSYFFCLPPATPTTMKPPPPNPLSPTPHPLAPHLSRASSGVYLEGGNAVVCFYFYFYYH